MTSDQVLKKHEGGSRAACLFALILLGLCINEIQKTIWLGLEKFSQPVPDLSIMVNSDAEAQLRLLPGVGLAISSQVINLRAIEPFADFNDFETRVRGVGPAFMANSGNNLDFSVAGVPGTGLDEVNRGQTP